MVPSNDWNSLNPTSSVKNAANWHNSYLNCNQFWCPFKECVCAQPLQWFMYWIRLQLLKQEVTVTNAENQTLHHTHQRFIWDSWLWIQNTGTWGVTMVTVNFDTNSLSLILWLPHTSRETASFKKGMPDKKNDRRLKMVCVQKLKPRWKW